mmetsp:Transcript_4571/g.13133  ORF Transcript_4571/g.13133 Transcript_4571/m.13133 type:complete len:278 (+) Transcript_4571:2141-2974(+)
MSTRPEGGFRVPSSPAWLLTTPLVPAYSPAATLAFSPNHQADILWNASQAASSDAACASTSIEAPVGAFALGGEGEDRMPSAACSAASLPARPALMAAVHISTTRDRFTPLGEAAATAPAQLMRRREDAGVARSARVMLLMTASSKSRGHAAWPSPDEVTLRSRDNGVMRGGCPGSSNQNSASRAGQRMAGPARPSATSCSSSAISANTAAVSAPRLRVRMPLRIRASPRAPAARAAEHTTAGDPDCSPPMTRSPITPIKVAASPLANMPPTASVSA